MSRRLRVYYYTIFGALGGLLAWQLSSLLGLSFANNIYLSEAIVGGLIGLCIGFPLGAAEGVITRNPVRAIRMAAFSGLLGFVAGAVGLPLGEWLFQTAGAEVLGRALGWAILGMALGIAEGIIGGAQVWKGAVGGAVGGLVGGALLEFAGRQLSSMSSFTGLGLILLGASIGAFIALIVVLLSRAWIEVVAGKLQGSEFILDKFLASHSPSAIIGSSALKAEIALPDPDISPQHAVLKGADTHFTLRDISLSGTFVGSRRISQALLADGQVIQMGNTKLVYHERR